MGTSHGAVVLADACLRRYRRGDFEFTYTSSSQVIVKQVSSGPCAYGDASTAGLIASRKHTQTRSQETMKGRER